MSTLHKMKVLTDSAQYDLCDYVNHQKSSQVNLPGIYHATGHNGCQIPLFKTLMKGLKPVCEQTDKKFLSHA